MSGKQEKTVQAGGLDSHGTFSYCYCTSRSVTPVASWPPSPMTWWAHFPDGSAWYAGTSQKWLTAILHPHSGVALKMMMKANPPRRQNVWLLICWDQDGQMTGSTLAHGQ